MFAAVNIIGRPWFRRRLPEPELVRLVVAELRDDQRAELAGVTLTVRNRPGRRDLRRGCDPRQWGYFVGVRPVDDEIGPVLPSGAGPVGEIVLFRRNYPQTWETFRALLLHELAHVLGYDDDDLEDRGLAS